MKKEEGFAALSRIGVLLMSERDENHLMHLIAQTARDLTGAQFAAFSLRAVNALGEPMGPSEGSLFHLAAVIGVTKEQEELFRRMPLGGEGLLAPIFRYGVPVRIEDVVRSMYEPERLQHVSTREQARQNALAFAHGQLAADELRSLGVPHGHPVIRSFLGAPLLDQQQQVRGGLLLGHAQPGCFTEEDETLLVGLAAQAAVALENIRLYQVVVAQAQELHAMFQSITDGVTLVDFEGRILRENASAQEIRTRLDALPDGKEIVEQLLYAPVQQTLEGKRVKDVTITIAGLQGESQILSVSALPLRQQGEVYTGVVVVWKDVTEEHRILLERQEHAATQAHRVLLQYVLNEMPGSVYLVYGAEARLIMANEVAKTIWGGYWPIGMPMQEFLEQQGVRILSSDGRPLHAAQLATFRALQHGEIVHHFQEIIRYPNGATLPVLVNAIVLDARHVPSTYIDVGAVATGECESEQQRIALVVHQDVTALKEAEQIKDDFIAIAAHELRSPLAILKGFAETLITQSARGHGPKLAEWQTDALQSIDQATARLVELTNDLLDVTRLQAGRLELCSEVINVVRLMRLVIGRLQKNAPEHRLVVDYLEQAVYIQVDTRRFEQVLTNLVNNAVKYSPDGGEITITLMLNEKGDEVQVCIRDEGIGIPAHQQASIFERFVRGENAEMLGISGTGLGLYLCRELVERMGGRIWFESKMDEGTTFHLMFPLYQEME